MLAGEAYGLFKQFAKAIELHVNFNMDLGLALKKQGQENYDNSLQTLLLIAGGATVLTMGLFVWLFNQVANPLRTAMDTLTRIQRDLNFTLRADVKQQDEIGLTLNAVNRAARYTLQQTFTGIFRRQLADQEHCRIPLSGSATPGQLG